MAYSGNHQSAISLTDKLSFHDQQCSLSPQSVGKPSWIGKLSEAEASTY